MEDIDEETFTNSIVYFFLVELIREINLPLYYRLKSIVNGISNVSIDSLSEAVFATRVLTGVTLGEDITPILNSVAGPKIEVLEEVFNVNTPTFEGGGGNDNSLVSPSVVIPDISNSLLLLYFMTLSLKKRLFGSRPTPSALFEELSQRIPIALIEELKARGAVNTSNVKSITKQTTKLAKAFNTIRDLNIYVRQTFLPSLFEHTERNLNVETLSEESVQKLVAALEHFRNSKNVSAVIPALANIHAQTKNRNTRKRNGRQNQVKFLNNIRNTRNNRKTQNNRIRKSAVQFYNNTMNWNLNAMMAEAVRGEEANKEYGFKVSSPFNGINYIQLSGKNAGNSVSRTAKGIIRFGPNGKLKSVQPFSSNSTLNTLSVETNGSVKGLVVVVGLDGKKQQVNPSQLSPTAAKLEQTLLDSFYTHIGMSLIHLNRTEVGGQFFIDFKEKTLRILSNIQIGGRGGTHIPIIKGAYSNRICAWHSHPHSVDRILSPPSTADLMNTLFDKTWYGIENGCVMTPEGLYIYTPTAELIDLYLTAYTKYYWDGKQDLLKLPGNREKWEEFQIKLTGIIKSNSKFIQQTLFTRHPTTGPVREYLNMGELEFDNKKIKLGFNVRLITSHDLYSGTYVEFGKPTKNSRGGQVKYLEEKTTELSKTFQIDSVVNTTTGKAIWTPMFDVPVRGPPPEFIPAIFANATEAFIIQQTALYNRKTSQPITHIEHLEKAQDVLSTYPTFQGVNQSIYRLVEGQVKEYPLRQAGRFNHASQISYYK